MASLKGKSSNNDLTVVADVSPVYDSTDSLTYNVADYTTYKTGTKPKATITTPGYPVGSIWDVWYNTNMPTVDYLINNAPPYASLNAPHPITGVSTIVFKTSSTGQANFQASNTEITNLSGVFPAGSAKIPGQKSSITIPAYFTNTVNPGYPPGSAYSDAPVAHKTYTFASFCSGNEPVSGISFNFTTSFTLMKTLKHTITNVYNYYKIYTLTLKTADFATFQDPVFDPSNVVSSVKSKVGDHEEYLLTIKDTGVVKFSGNIGVVDVKAEDGTIKTYTLFIQ